MKKDNMKKVCLLGRPNVGKSTLFNRIIGLKKALVLDEPGVTRDVHIKKVNWEGYAEFELADLAGLEHGTLTKATKVKSDKEKLRELSIETALEYLKKSDLVLFIFDAREGILPLDHELLKIVRKVGKQFIPVLSKAEGKIKKDVYEDLSQLGTIEPLETSAEHNQGIDDLKDEIKKYLDEEDTSEKVLIPQDYLKRGEDKDNPIRLGVYGKPNVGKSTLVNAILGEKRMITSPIAGTTVDTVDSDFIHEGVFYRIMDTAGIRKKSKTGKGVEVISVVKSLNTLDEVDVALFIIDGYEGISDQDEKVAGELLKSGKPVAIIVNKWDLCRVKEEKYADRIREEVGFLDFAPILFISSEKKKGLDSIFDIIKEMIRQRKVIATTGELNRLIEHLEAENNPKMAKIYYASQTSSNPPTITLIVNDPKKMHFAYQRFIKNSLRNHYGWMGSPLRIVIKIKKRSPSKKQYR